MKIERMKSLRARFADEPLAKTLNCRLTRLRPGFAELRAVIPGTCCIVGGIAQGGVTTSLADYAGVYAAMTKISQGHTPCVQISINFLRPIMVGESVEVKARVLNESRRNIVVDVQVYGRDVRNGVMKLKATSQMLFQKPKPRT